MKWLVVLAAAGAAALVWRSRHGPEVWHELDEQSA
jgi:hypothetical protein